MNYQDQKMYSKKKKYYSHFNSRVNDIIKYSRTSNEIPNSGGGLIFWKTSGTWIDTTNGLKRNPTVDLAHELFHAQDTNNGRLSEEEYNYLSINEWRASYNENLFRKQIGTSLRTLYKSVDQNKKQHIVPLLDADGNPWKPY